MQSEKKRYFWLLQGLRQSSIPESRPNRGISESHY